MREPKLTAEQNAMVEIMGSASSPPSSPMKSIDATMWTR